MKIVLVSHHFPPKYNAGTELITARVARWLHAHGYEVEVVCVENIDQGSPDQAEAIKDCYQNITVWRLTLDLFKSPDRFTHNYDNPIIGQWLSNYLKEARPDLVHIQSGYIMSTSVVEAAHKQGIPVVLSANDFWYICPKITLLRGDGSLCEEIPTDPAGCAWCMIQDGRRYRLPDQLSGGLLGKTIIKFGMKEQRQGMTARRARTAQALEWADVVIAPSQHLANRFAPYVAPEKLHVSRSGLELAPFQSQTRPPSDGVLRIGYTGQIAPHKGVHLLIEAFRKLKHIGNRPVELHIYGGLEAFAGYVKELKELAGNDPRIHFKGRFENSKVAEVLAGLDCLVVPSLWHEIGPLTIMEAQAVGTPVLATALGNMAYIVKDEVDGLLFQPTATDLTRQLQRVLDDPALLPRLQAGITTPRSIDQEMEQITQLYHSVVKV